MYSFPGLLEEAQLVLRFIPPPTGNCAVSQDLVTTLKEVPARPVHSPIQHGYDSLNYPPNLLPVNCAHARASEVVSRKVVAVKQHEVL